MWTQHVPSGFLDEIRAEFADTPAVLELLEQEDGVHGFADALSKALPNKDFLQEPALFLKARDERGLSTLEADMETYVRRLKIYEYWNNHVEDAVFNAIEPDD